MAAESIKHRYDNIIKSPEDKRVFCGLELQNGLRILLISDATTDKSAAAMDVNIGSYICCYVVLRIKNVIYYVVNKVFSCVV